jgi:hypothetical protein
VSNDPATFAIEAVVGDNKWDREVHSKVLQQFGLNERQLPLLRWGPARACSPNPRSRDSLTSLTSWFDHASPRVAVPPRAGPQGKQQVRLPEPLPALPVTERCYEREGKETPSV